MTEVVNLRTVRKQRRRADERARSAAAAARSGGDAAEAARRKAEAELELRRHEGHRREDGEG